MTKSHSPDNDNSITQLEYLTTSTGEKNEAETAEKVPVPLSRHTWQTLSQEQGSSFIFVNKNEKYQQFVHKND